MEINKNTDIVGVCTTEDIVEGRFALYTSHPGYSNNVTGRLTDVPGVKLPETLAEAAEARFVITFPVNNVTPPLVVWPAYAWGLRGTFEQAGNMPASLNVALTYPGYQESQVVLSGYLALAFDAGVYTLPSGQYVYDPTMQIPGTRLRACDTATDGVAFKGMPAVMVSGGTCVAIVERFNTQNFALTLRTYRLP